MPSDRSSVALKTSSSTLGKRCGSDPIRQRCDADGHLGHGRTEQRRDTPSPARSASASPIVRWASIERETSTTTNASASVRTSDASTSAASTGCAAATPRKHRRDHERRPRDEQMPGRRLGEPERRRAPARAATMKRAPRAGARRRARGARRAGVRKQRQLRAPSVSRCRDRRRRRRSSPLPPGVGFCPPAPSVSWTRARAESASSRLYFASSFEGSSAIARRKFATVLDRSASRSWVSVTKRASPSTPRRPAARERRAASASSATIASSRACASFRLIATSWIGDGDDRVVQMGEPQRAERLAGARRRRRPPSSRAADVERQRAFVLPERRRRREMRDSSTSSVRQAASQPRRRRARARTSTTASHEADDRRRAPAMSDSTTRVRVTPRSPCLSRARGDSASRPAIALVRPRARRRRGAPRHERTTDAARSHAVAARSRSVAVSPERVPERRTHPPDQQCPEESPGVASTARAPTTRSAMPLRCRLCDRLAPARARRRVRSRGR